MRTRVVKNFEKWDLKVSDPLEEVIPDQEGKQLKRKHMAEYWRGRGTFCGLHFTRWGLSSDIHVKYRVSHKKLPTFKFE